MNARLIRIGDPAVASRTLTGAAMDLENRSAAAHDGARLRDQYHQWIDAQYNVICQHLGMAWADELLHDAFYWHSVDLDTGDARAGGRMFQGMRREANRLRDLAAEIDRVRAAFAAEPDWHTAVVDTNVLALTPVPWAVDWPALVGQPNTRVVLPLRVVEELDMYKYRDDSRLANAARDLLPRLEKRLTESATGTSTKVSDSIMIQVLMPPGERDRTLHADEEILRTCESLKSFGAQKVTLVTDDTAMRLQARARGIRAIGVPTPFRKPSAPTDIADQALASDVAPNSDAD